MEAKEGHGGSHAWKSILKGRGVIQRGAKWRVGDGESIKIYGDNWLPTASLSGVHGPLPSEFQNASVSSLINHQTRTWDFEVLSTALTPFEADLVQKIILSRGQSRDVLFWPFMQSGIYSVKSGYYFLKFETRSTATPALALPDHPKPPWNWIWKLNLPNKIKNSLWRTACNALPTSLELVRRCIINDPICSVSSSHCEDVLHALWSCPILSQVWEEDPQWSFKQTSRYFDFTQLLFRVLDSACNGELFATITWTIWFRRNKLRFSPSGLPLDQVMQTTVNSLLEFRKAQTLAEPKAARPRAKWIAPLSESFKINFDGAVFKDQNRVGVGVIIRDSHGLVMGSMSQVIPLPQTIVELEALAALKALKFAADLGLNYVVLEGDLEILMNALMDNSLSLASFGLLIQDIKAYVEFFRCIRFSHVCREGNIVAHNLARHPCHATGFTVWMEDVPSHTFAAYQADLPIAE